jgi:hypothetical protein
VAGSPTVGIPAGLWRRLVRKQLQAWPCLIALSPHCLQSSQRDSLAGPRSFVLTGCRLLPRLCRLDALSRAAAD